MNWLTRHWGAWLLLWCCSLAAQAQQFDRGLLWRIEKSGQPTSYLFGTIHTWNAGLADILQRAQPYLRRSSTVITELALTDATSAQIGRSMLLPEGQTLAGLLGEADYRRLLALTEPRAMGDQVMRQMKPWAALSLLILPTPEGGLPMDMQIMALAKAQGKPLIGLETVREQIDIFEQMPQAEQLLMLRATIDQGNTLSRYLEILFDLYWGEDLAGLVRVAIDDWPLEPEAQALNTQLMERLVYGRNRLMTARLQNHLRGKSVFVAVGALHLAGPRGIPALLTARGYRVTRIED